MLSYRRQWAEADFDLLSWHDNVIHGIRLYNPEADDQFDLILDIDHILHWEEKSDGSFAFYVAPALLTFHLVDNLECTWNLRYKEQLAIDRIVREPVMRRPSLIPSYRWVIHLNAYTGACGVISFDAVGFTQRLTKDPIKTLSQCLEHDQR